MSTPIRSLAAEAGLTVDETLARLRAAGLKVAKGGQRLEGKDLRVARAALGMKARTRDGDEAPRLHRDALIVQMLRPLRAKGKLGKNHTTEIGNVVAHGIPDHQKDEARALADALVKEGVLGEKPSNGRRHVWLTPEEGVRALEEAERRSTVPPQP